MEWVTLKQLLPDYGKTVLILWKDKVSSRVCIDKGILHSTITNGKGDTHIWRLSSSIPDLEPTDGNEDINNYGRVTKWRDLPDIPK